MNCKYPKLFLLLGMADRGADVIWKLENAKYMKLEYKQMKPSEVFWRESEGENSTFSCNFHNVNQSKLTSLSFLLSK